VTRIAISLQNIFAIAASCGSGKDSRSGTPGSRMLRPTSMSRYISASFQRIPGILRYGGRTPFDRGHI
jgi:hypothetical protein